VKQEDTDREWIVVDSPDSSGENISAYELDDMEEEGEREMK